MELKAKSWTWHKKGEPSDLILEEKTIRPLGDHEVLIQNTVIGLNPVDWKLIESGNPAWKSGSTPGVDAAGIIVAVGNKMTHLKVGARVCYHTDLSKDGSFSTHTIVSGFALMSIPQNVSDESAAAFPCPSLTAWQALTKIPDLSGKNVLVSGAGGSVGYFLTQLLLHAKAKVYVTANPKHHTEFLNMGVLKAIDYKESNWKQLILDSANGNLFDVVFDTVSGAHASGLVSLLAYYGHLVSIQDRVDKNPLGAFTTCISLHEIALGAIHQYGSAKQMAQLMLNGEKLLSRVGNGELRQRDSSINSFGNLSEHLAKMKKDNSSTKYLIKIS